MLITASLLGIGIGLAFAALGNLIVQAVPPSQTGVATGMNTVMRTLGGALGGQLSATFIADHQSARPADRDRLHRDVRHGGGVPGRVPARGPARPRAPASFGHDQARRAVRDHAGLTAPRGRGPGPRKEARDQRWRRA